MAEKSTIITDLGTFIRDKIRLDATILAKNPTVTGQNWIFFERPNDMFDTKFPVPRIVVEIVDENREDWNTAGEKDITIPFIIHGWVDLRVAQPYDAANIADQLGVIVEALEDQDPKIHDIDVASVTIDPEAEDTRVLKHITVRAFIVWREST